MSISDFCTLSISVLALAITLWQLGLMRRHNRLTYKPILQWRNSTEKDRRYKVSISNVGLGPSTITSIKYSHKKEDLTQDEFMSLFIEKGCEIKSYNKVYAPMTIPSNGSKLLIDIRLPIDTDGVNKILPCIQIKVHYKSIYGEVFVLQYND